MRFPTKVVVTGAAAMLLLLPVLSHAASLTADQVNSVIGLLQSFNVETKTVDTVKAVLTGAKPPHLDDDDDDDDDDDRVASSTEGMKKSLPPGQVGKALCISLMRNLGVGSRGDDVRKLQDMLYEEGVGFSASTTGYYGPMTAKAMKRFQEKNGIASTTGFVGPMTRGILERRCGKGLSMSPGFPGTATGTQPLPPTPPTPPATTTSTTTSP